MVFNTVLLLQKEIAFVILFDILLFTEICRRVLAFPSFNHLARLNVKII